MERENFDSFAAHFRPAIRFGIPDRTPGGQVTKTTCVVEFRSGEAVHHHPELKRYVTKGWTIRSAAPYADESESVQLIVVLEKECERT